MVQNEGFLSRMYFCGLDKLISKTNRGEKVEFSDLPPFVLQERTLYYKIMSSFPRVSLWNALYSIYYRQYHILFLLSVIHVLCIFAPSIILKQIIRNLQTTPPSIVTGLIWATCLFLINLISSLVSHQRSLISNKVALRVEGELQNAIYRKFLDLKDITEMSSEKISNLLGSESSKVSSLISRAHLLWESPMVILLAFSLLYLYCGPSSMVGLFTLLFIPTNFVLSRIHSHANEKYTKFKNERIKICNDMLQNMRIVKQSALDPVFEAKIKKIRENELSALKSTQIIYSLQGIALKFILFCANLFTILLHVYYYEELNVVLIFQTLNWYFALERPIIFISEFTTDLYHGLKSAKTIQSFLGIVEEEQEDNEVIGDDDAVVMDGAYFKPRVENVVPLENLTLSIKKKSVCCVVGSIGSGKSSLLQAISSALPLIAGRLKVNGDIAFCDQKPWMISGTIRDNIIIGSLLSQEKYDSILECCQLKIEIEKLVNKDLTSVDELSESVKHRISLARACYSDSDIILLDNVLAAQDTFTGLLMFEDCLRGFLKDKTIILATHLPEIIRQADQVITLQKGQLNDSETNFKEDSMTPGWIESKHVEIVDKTAVIPKEVEIEVSISDYYAYLSEFGSYLYLGIFFVVISSFMKVMSGVVLSYWVSNRFSLESNIYIIIYASMGTIMILALALHKIYSTLGGVTASREIHQKMLHSVCRSPISFFEKTPHQLIGKKFSNDQSKVDHSLQYDIPNLFGHFFYIFVVLLIIIVIEPITIMVIVIILLLYVLVYKVIRRPFIIVRKYLSKFRAPLYSHFSTTYSGFSSIKSYQIKEKMARDYEVIVDNHHHTRISEIILNSWAQMRLEILSAIIVLSTAILALYTNLGPVSTAIVIYYSLSISEVCSSAVKTFVFTEIGINSSHRIHNYIDLPHEPLIKDKQQPGWPEQGKIEFKNVYCEEPENRLSDLSFELPSRLSVAVINGDAVLKSLLQMTRISQGEIYVDGLNILQIGTFHLRRSISIIPRNPVLFLGTLRFNLDPFEKFSDEEIWDALDAVSMKTRIQESKGLDLDDAIYNLSSGEILLLHVAKALLNKNKIIMFDKVLFESGMRSIYTSILEKLNGKTLVYLSQQRSMVQQAEKCLVLNERGENVIYDASAIALKDDRVKNYLK